MKANVNEDLCIGCELCVSTCPEVFSMNDDGKAQAIESMVPMEIADNCRKAAQECPVEAITIF